MYKIETVQGEHIATVEHLTYARLNPNSGAWITTDHISAEALLIEGKLYNIAGYPIIENYPIVKITDIGQEVVSP